MQRISEKIADLLGSHQKQGLTLGQLLDKMDQQGIGFMMAVLALPLLLPLPPGVAAPAGILLLIWSVQRLFGMHLPWCPVFLRRKTLSSKTVHLLTKKGIPIIRKLERYTGGSVLPVHELTTKAACLVVVVMAVLIIMPTPFINPLFAVIVLLLGLGLAYLNVKLYLAGIAGGVAVVAMFLAGYLAVAMDDLWFPF